MSAMQNYAKFDSRVLSESANDMVQQKSFGNSYYGGSIVNDILNILEILIQFFIGVFIAFIVIFVLFFFLYLIISLISKGGEKTMLEIKTIGDFSKKYVFKIYSSIFNFFKNIFLFFWNRKILTVLLVLIYFGFGFFQDVVSGQSKFLKLTKINTGYVGIDLKHKELLQPGYHLYSPINTSIFLSPTNDFDFEIAEVTANTSEELGVTLDYRVGFKLIDEKRLDFYNKYGAKNIQLVSSDIVMPKLLEVLKGTIRNYSFKDISSSHDEIKSITLKAANKVLNELGVDLQDITILDVRLPKSYLTSKEDLLKSENELKLAEARFETQKKESEKQLLEAENRKKVKIIEAEAIAEYNKIVKSETITDDMIEMKKLENQTLKINKWDGKLPNTVGDNLDL